MGLSYVIAGYVFVFKLIILLYFLHFIGYYYVNRGLLFAVIIYVYIYFVITLFSRFIS